MANSKQARKRIRQAEVRRDRNRAALSRLRSSVKQLRAAADTDLAQAQELLPGTLGVIDVTARKGAIHANAAARRKSRLTRLVNRRLEAATAATTADAADQESAP